MHICMLLLILCFLTSCSYSKEVPKAENGILDLTDWDLEMDGAVKLDGEWDFYWKQLLTPEDFAKKTEFR